MRILLDTNAYSHFKRGSESVADIVHHANHLYFSTIVAGELLYGFRNGSNCARNTAELREFINHPLVSTVSVSLETADRFSRIAACLRKNGTPIPSNDIWIAAQALEYGADLISFDQHFEKIEGLVWIRPE